MRHLDNLGPLIKTGLPSALRSHQVELFGEGPGRGISARCACGWEHRYEAEEIIAAMQVGPGALDRIIHRPLDEHREEVLAQQRPSLAELTSWGWFCPEAG